MNHIIAHPKLYTVDSTGKTRFFFMEQEGLAYRTVTGIEGGKSVTSGWKYAEATNVGQSNERDPELQATAEIESQYKKKHDRKYYDKIDAAAGTKYFQPMLAEKYKDYGWQGPCFAQPKLDGIRCIATKDGLWSRAGKRFVAAPHIELELCPFFEQYPNAKLDGELYNHELKDDFNKITSLVKKQKPTVDELAECMKLVQYHMYDVIFDDDASFNDRFFNIHFHLLSKTNSIRVVETYFFGTEAQLDEWYGRWLENGYEGQMVRLDLPYENRRSKSLMKRKEFIDAEFPLVSIEEGVGNWAGYGKRAICSLPDGRVFGAGVKGNQEFAKQLLVDAKNYDQVTVRYQNLTPDGIPRFPIAVAFHEKGQARL